MNRAQAVSDLSKRVERLDLHHPVRVAIDGVDASGKTSLANELVAALRAEDRIAFRVSIDRFHNPRKIRYRQGRQSPCGYYEDSFNYSAIVRDVLQPLGPGGSLRFRRAAFDFMTDSEVNAPDERAHPRAVLIFEGVFLHRPELRDQWDMSVFVEADFDIALKRAQKRDLYLFDTPDKVRQQYERRYIPAQRMYLALVEPSRRATVVWDNNEIDDPVLSYNGER